MELDVLIGISLDSIRKTILENRPETDVFLVGEIHGFIPKTGDLLTNPGIYSEICRFQNVNLWISM